MKKYEYKGKIYCDDDLSEKIDNFGGDLWTLCDTLIDEGEVNEVTYFYPRDCESSAQMYESREELIENEFEHLLIEK